MNAIEHGNDNDPQLLVEIVVDSDGTTVEVLRQRSRRRPARAAATTPRSPTSRRSSTACRRPRGWGLFLIRSMVDAMDVVADPDDPTPAHRAAAPACSSTATAPTAEERHRACRARVTSPCEPAADVGGTAVMRIGRRGRRQRASAAARRLRRGGGCAAARRRCSSTSPPSTTSTRPASPSSSSVLAQARADGRRSSPPVSPSTTGTSSRSPGSSTSSSCPRRRSRPVGTTAVAGSPGGMPWSRSTSRWTVSVSSDTVAVIAVTGDVTAACEQVLWQAWDEASVGADPRGRAGFHRAAPT